MANNLQIDPSRGWFRQGDVAFIPVVQNISLDTAVERQDKVIMHGEITGHAHRALGAGCAVLELNEDLLLHVSDPEQTSIVHEDHDPTGEGFKSVKTGEVETMPAGLYLIRRQRELGLEKINFVQD